MPKPTEGLPLDDGTHTDSIDQPASDRGHWFHFNVGTVVLRRLQQAAGDHPGSVEVVGFARRLPDTTQAPYAGCEWHALDIGTDEGRAALTAALEGVDAVVHLAWAIQPNRNEGAMHRTNVTGTANALQATADASVRHFVCASLVGA
ncbi:NAD-dependent epimerase/dehydratase family protein [Arthrobacter sp. CAN_A1]|uniref:NAD-dependent epimerase/dehydratase family protein n=1 Tax=Arthrobacter sp. CAN_A1 TaxID=2787717 RepID=UPI001A28AF61